MGRGGPRAAPTAARWPIAAAAIVVIAALAAMAAPAVAPEAPEHVTVGLIFPLTRRRTGGGGASGQLVRNEAGATLLSSALLAVDDINAGRILASGAYRAAGAPVAPAAAPDGGALLPNTTLRFEVIDTTDDEEEGFAATLRGIIGSAPAGAGPPSPVRSRIGSAIVPGAMASTQRLLSAFGIPHMTLGRRAPPGAAASPAQRASPGAAASAATAAPDALYDALALVELIGKLKGLADEGAITPEMFAAKRAELFDRI